LLDVDKGLDCLSVLYGFGKAGVERTAAENCKQAGENGFGLVEQKMKELEDGRIHLFSVYQT